MLIQQILLKIYHKFHNERTISAAFHLLRGKRSGQTIQDVGIFKLYPYFGLLPKLSRKNFDMEIDLLLAYSYLTIQENSYYKLTDSGIAKANEPFPYTFDGWHYRGNEHLFFSRLSLVIQSLSHQAARVHAFIPIEKNETTQQWVREFLRVNHYHTKTMQPALLTEIEDSLTATEVDESLKETVIFRLTGYKQAGLTWEQLSFSQRRQELDVQLCYISCLHNWLNVIMEHKESYPLLYQMTQQIRIEIPLTGSAVQTAQLFNKGYQLEQISQMRRLKTSTIEDHIVELAMNDPQFNLQQFVSDADRTLVHTAMKDYDTKKLKVLHEVVPHLSFFQLRLVLAKGDEI